MISEALAQSPPPVLLQTSAQPSSRSPPADPPLSSQQNQPSSLSPSYGPHPLMSTPFLRLGSPKETLSRGFGGQWLPGEASKGGESRPPKGGFSPALPCGGKLAQPPPRPPPGTQKAGWVTLDLESVPSSGHCQGLPRGCKFPGTAHFPSVCRLGGSGSWGARTSRSPRASMRECGKGVPADRDRQ